MKALIFIALVGCGVRPMPATPVSNRMVVRDDEPAVTIGEAGATAYWDQARRTSQRTLGPAAAAFRYHHAYRRTPKAFW